jgi:hypothetical protein
VPTSSGFWVLWIGRSSHFRPCFIRPVIRFFLFLLVWFLRAVLRTRGSLVIENLALRQQLATFARGQKRAQLKPEERAFWVTLSRL